MLADKDEALDKSGMLAKACAWPEMFAQGLGLKPSLPIKAGKKINQLVVAGMGGSAIAGDILITLASQQSPVPIFVIRNYSLPAFVGPDALLVAISYSGNTEEVLAAVKEGLDRGVKIIALASGGQLKNIAEKNKLPLVLVPGGLQPRAALPYLLAGLLNVAATVGLFSLLEKDLEAAVSLLEKLAQEYGPAKPAKVNLARQLAVKLLNKLPIIFASSASTDAAALRFKTQLNENSKTTALVNFFPELDHNEIVSLATLVRGQHPHCWLLLRDEKDNERIKKRMEITKSLIGNQLGGAIEIWAQGETPLARLLSLIILGDFVSVYLALLKGLDPTPVEVIGRLKKELLR